MLDKKRVLYLASSSKSRQDILRSAKIDFKVISQTSQEICDYDLEFDKLVESIAINKMQHIVLPPEFSKNSKLQKGDEIFVLTADTMTKDKNGKIHGKPENKLDCIEKIKEISGVSYTCTAFCLDKKVFDGASWVTENRHLESIIAECDFEIPIYANSSSLASQEVYDSYIKNTDALNCCGALDITGFGAQFLKSVNGSYSGILGLPMFEVRRALTKLGFFQN